MPQHCRRTLRETAATLLTGLTTTGSRVHQSRIPPRLSSDLPCILIHTESEHISPATIGNPQDRALEVVVEGYAMVNANLDDTLDQIAYEVEVAMSNDARFRLRRINVDFDESLEKPAGVIRLTFEILFFTTAGDPGTFA